MFGKWHCGWLPWFSPLRIGFQQFFGNLDGAIDYFEHIGTLGEDDLFEGETPIKQTGYYTDLVADRAAESVGQDRDRPFYLQLNFTAPHWPWEGRGDAAVGARIRADYEAGLQPFPLLHLDGGSLAQYAELVETMDDAIGRVPFLLRWPAAVDPHQVSEQPNITMDWTATLLDAAGTGPGEGYPLDGASLLPWLVDGADYPEHDLFWRIASQGSLRRGSYKYLRDGRDRAIMGNWPRRFWPKTEFLYDVTVDGREAADLARHHPALMAEFRDAWDRIDGDLIPYPPDHPNVPRPPQRAGSNQAGSNQPAVSQAD